MMGRRLEIYGESLDEGQGAGQHCPLGKTPLSITVSPAETPLQSLFPPLTASLIPSDTVTRMVSLAWDWGEKAELSQGTQSSASV